MKERKITAKRTVRPAEPAKTGNGWQSFLLRHWAMVGLVLILLFTAGIRLRLLEFPLERDEGEYAYMGQLMLQGFPPYESAYNMKFPGTYAAYALIMAVFGQTIAGIHLGVLLVNAGAIVLVFLIGRRLFDGPAGLMAAATYALMTMGQRSLGMAGHATHFVILPALGATLLMLKLREDPRVWRSLVIGLLLGISVLMKQPGFLFVLMAWLYILWVFLGERPRQLRQTLVSTGFLALGVAIPLMLTGLILWRAGVFAKFWYWTIVYAKAYGSQIPLVYGPKSLYILFPVMAANTWPLWLLAAAGLVLLFFDRGDRKRLVFTIGFAVFSFLAVCPSLLFRNHYFILLMPAAGILIGGGLSVLWGLLRRWGMPAAWLLPLLVFLGVWGYVFNSESDFLLRMNTETACRTTYGVNPFVESLEVAKYLKERTSPDDKIAVIGSEPQIYFYAHRRSATGYIYTYPLMEKQSDALRMQEEMASQIEAAAPRYLVFVNVRTSWLLKPGSQMWILDEWMNRYIQNYDVVGRIDIFSDGSRYRWDAEAANGRPMSEYFLLVFKRK
jgi:hypothetical protein